MKFAKRYRDLKRRLRHKSEEDKKINTFVENFRRIMFEKNIYDSFDNTITPVDIKLIETNGASGIKCRLDFPLGLSSKDLDKALDGLKENLYGKCMVIIERLDKKVNLTAVNSWFNIPYKPHITDSASELFLGYDMACEPSVIDLSSKPHLLITGSSGGGKSKLVEIILTNLAYNNDPNDLELYFLQVAKDDQFRYELLKHTKGCVTSTSGKDPFETLTLALLMLEYIDEEVTKRERLVKERLGRKPEDSNIHIYNEKFPKEKMPVLMLWIDEASSLYQTNSSMGKEEKAIRARVEQITMRIAQTGRYIGVYMINVMQRASKDELPRYIKVNVLNKVAFNQADGSASKVAIDDEVSAVGLPQQVFAYKKGTETVFFAKTPQSKWNKNLRILRERDRVRKDNTALIMKEYKHWLNTNEIEEKVNSVKVKDMADDSIREELEIERNKNKQLLKEIDVYKSKIKGNIEPSSMDVDLDVRANATYTNADEQKNYFANQTSQNVAYVKKSFENVKVKVKANQKK